MAQARVEHRIALEEGTVGKTFHLGHTKKANPFVPICLTAPPGIPQGPVLPILGTKPWGPGRVLGTLRVPSGRRSPGILPTVGKGGRNGRTPTPLVPGFYPLLFYMAVTSRFPNWWRTKRF